MKRTRTLSIFFLVGMMFAGSACTVKSVRETPTVKVVKQYASTVVNIRTERIVDLKEHPEWGKYGEELDRFFEQYFSESYAEGILKLKSVGSGVIVDKQGLVVTNAHVVQKASSIYVVLNDGTVSEAKVLQVSQDDDLAIVKTEFPHPVKQATFADIKELMIGETVIAIGNPFGLENSVTVGVLSGIDRSFSSPQCQYVCSGLLQTDASINPGNSGGALFNLNGELLGVNLAVVSGAENIGFAIPVHKAQKLLNEIQ